MKYWIEHSKTYDRFMTAYPRYLSMLDFHRQALRKCNLVLDSGAGTGNLTLALLEDGHNVVAADSNEYALNILKRKCKPYISRLNVVKIDLSKKTSFSSDYFDGAASCLVVPLVTRPELYLTEIYRTLKNGGYFSASPLLPKKGLFDYLINTLETDIKHTGLTIKYRPEWKKFIASAKENAKQIMKKSLEAEELMSMLDRIGFSEIEVSNDRLFNGYIILVRCRK
ncbi:class I SAM-dependent methyltransferase [archaeon]|nr:class I SAM-dependent methyltransferase [archaeon]